MPFNNCKQILFKTKKKAISGTPVITIWQKKKHSYGHIVAENLAFWTYWIPENGIASIENIKFVTNNQENEKQDVKNIMGQFFGTLLSNSASSTRVSVQGRDYITGKLVPSIIGAFVPSIIGATVPSFHMIGLGWDYLRQYLH